MSAKTKKATKRKPAKTVPAAGRTTAEKKADADKAALLAARERSLGKLTSIVGGYLNQLYAWVAEDGGEKFTGATWGVVIEMMNQGEDAMTELARVSASNHIPRG